MNSHSKQALAALKAGTDYKKDPDVFTYVGDLIANLKHLCKEKGVDFADCLRRGENHFRDETYVPKTNLLDGVAAVQVDWPFDGWTVDAIHERRNVLLTINNSCSVLEEEELSALDTELERRGIKFETGVPMLEWNVYGSAIPESADEEENGPTHCPDCGAKFDAGIEAGVVCPSCKRGIVEVQ